MTKNQKEILKKLGYKETDEDGAILEHETYSYWSTISSPRLDFVWKNDTFDYILENYADWISRSARRSVSIRINHDT